MKPNFTLNQISKAVCDYYQVDEKSIQIRSKKNKTALIRQMFFYMAVEFTEQSSIKIADFSERDHATVLHGSKKVRIEKEIYKSVKTDIEEISAKLFGCGLIPIDIDLLKLTKYYSKTIID